MAEPLLHVTFDAECTVQAIGAAKGQNFKQCGLALDAGRGLCIAAGQAGKGQMATFAATTVQRVHTKFLGSGKLTFEVDTGKHGVRQLLISKASPDELKALLSALDEATRRARAKSVKVAPQDEIVAMLQARYPEQVRKQLAKLRQAAGNDAPNPLKGHHRLMLVVDAAGKSVQQAGKALCKLVEGEFKLTSSPRPGESNSQNFKAVCKDAADKSLQLELRVRACVHHKWSSALWLDMEVGEKVSAGDLRAAIVREMAQGDEQRALVTQLAHGAIKERLAANLAVHIRSGQIGGASDFGTRLELRWGAMEASASPLAKCDLRFWEAGSRMAAPVVTAFELMPEPCKAWSMANGDRPISVLAASLVARLEVFCLRLAASASGVGTRTRLLVAGWEAAVLTAPFVKRGFTFQEAPDASLGFKMLRSQEAKKSDAADAAASASPVPNADGAAAAAATSADATAGVSAAATASSAAAAAAAAEGKDTPGGLATGVGALGKRRREVAEGDEGMTPVAPPPAGTEAPAEVAPPAVEFEELGADYFSNLAQGGGASKPGDGEAAAPFVPVVSKFEEVASAPLMGGGGIGGDEEDELDATMAELLGE